MTSLKTLPALPPGITPAEQQRVGKLLVTAEKSFDSIKVTYDRYANGDRGTIGSLPIKLRVMGNALNDMARISASADGAIAASIARVGADLLNASIQGTPSYGRKGLTGAAEQAFLDVAAPAVGNALDAMKAIPYVVGIKQRPVSAEPAPTPPSETPQQPPAADAPEVEAPEAMQPPPAPEVEAPEAMQPLAPEVEAPESMHPAARHGDGTPISQQPPAPIDGSFDGTPVSAQPPYDASAQPLPPYGAQGAY